MNNRLAKAAAEAGFKPVESGDPRSEDYEKLGGGRFFVEVQFEDETHSKALGVIVGGRVEGAPYGEVSSLPGGVAAAIAWMRER